MIKAPPLDIPTDAALNPRDTFQAQMEPAGVSAYQAIMTLSLPEKKGSIILDTTRLASKKDLPPEKQLFLPKDEMAMMRWMVVGLHHVLSNSRKFGLPPLQDMFCSRDMNVLTIKVNGTPRDFRLISRPNADTVIKYLNELYAPNSPYLWKEGGAPAPAPVEPAPAPIAVAPAPVAAPPAPAPAPVVTAPAAPPPPPVVVSQPAPVVVAAPAPAPVAAPEPEPEPEPVAISLPALETGMLFLSKSGSGKLRTVEMVGDFANLYEKAPDGPWTHDREFDPSEMDVFVAWLYDNCDLQAERVTMAEVKGA